MWGRWTERPGGAGSVFTRFLFGRDSFSAAAAAASLPSSLPLVLPASRAAHRIASHHRHRTSPPHCTAPPRQWLVRACGWGDRLRPTDLSLATLHRHRSLSVVLSVALSCCSPCWAAARRLGPAVAPHLSACRRPSRTVSHLSGQSVFFFPICQKIACVTRRCC